MTFTFVKFLLRKGIWCARMFAVVFGSRVCEGCVCAATYCVNADSRWVGTQMHNSTLADEEDDILNIEKLTFS